MRRRAPLLCFASIACGRAVAPTSDVATDAGALVLLPPPVREDAGTVSKPVGKRTLEENTVRFGFDAPTITHVLYTWTTEEQLQLLRKGAPVLQRSFSPGKGFASYDHALYESVANGDAGAKLLWHEGFARSRFAWSNAFGAAGSLRGESYGPVLLRITLRPEAAFYQFNLEHEAVVHALGHDAEPSRIGSVRFVTRKYREYVLPNESMIERVEAYTPALRQDVEEQLEFLRSLAESEKSVPPHMLSTFFPHLQVLAGPDVLRTAISALERMLASPAPSFERQVSAAFELGKLRLSIEELCIKAKVTKSSVRMDSFGRQDFFTPECTSRAKAECIAYNSRLKEKAACRVLPEFFE